MESSVRLKEGQINVIHKLQKWRLAKLPNVHFQVARYHVNFANEQRTTKADAGLRYNVKMFLLMTFVI